MSHETPTLPSEITHLRQTFDTPDQTFYYRKLLAEFFQALQGHPLHYWAQDKRADLKQLRLVEQAFIKVIEFTKQPLTSEQIFQEQYGQHLEVAQQFFVNLERVELPRPDELTDEYFEKRYPNVDKDHQREEDKKRGLICFRPEWWDDAAITSGLGGEESWGAVYIHSMRTEMKKLYAKGGVSIVSEVLNNLVLEDSLLDKLGMGSRQSSRCNLRMVEIKNEIVPMVRETLEKLWTQESLEIPKFQVICTPALVAREIMEKYPEMSRADMQFWTSTRVLDKNDKDVGLPILVGGLDEGGAGCVFFNFDKGFNTTRSFGLSIVFESPSV